MIITCPNCGYRYELQRRPPVTFRCRKCSFSLSFNLLLNSNGNQSLKDVTNSESAVTSENIMVSAATNNTIVENKTEVVTGLADNHTRVVPSLQYKTQVVPSLQQKKGVLQVSFNGHPYSTIPLPFGSFDLGRMSSDSKAMVKITPDMSMSRIHAGMRTTKVNGQTVYQITSAKNENPVYVNNQPVGKGKACNLKNGDVIKMGETSIVFRLL